MLINYFICIKILNKLFFLLNVLQIILFVSLLYKQHLISICSIIKQLMLNKSINYRLLRSIYFITNIKEILIIYKLSFIFNNIMLIIKQLKMINFLLSVLTAYFALIQNFFNVIVMHYWCFINFNLKQF